MGISLDLPKDISNKVKQQVKEQAIESKIETEENLEENVTSASNSKESDETTLRFVADEFTECSTSSQEIYISTLISTGYTSSTGSTTNEPITTFPTSTMAAKPNFLNLKKVILQRYQMNNQNQQKSHTKYRTSSTRNPKLQPLILPAALRLFQPLPHPRPGQPPKDLLPLVPQNATNFIPLFWMTPISPSFLNGDL